MTDAYFTVAEVAKQLKCHKGSVYRWIADGKLVAYKAGKKVLIAQWSLDSFVKAK